MKTNSPVKLLKGQIFPIFMGMFLMFSLSSFAQTAKKEVVEIKIKTSAVCNMCKESIEKGLIYEKGIKDVTLDVDSKIATVKYRSDKTTPEIIKKFIASLGYDADEIPADKTAYQKLPSCCKKDSGN